MNWAHWRSQLAGENNPLGDTPCQGFYLLRRRLTYRNPDPGPGKPRNKVKEIFEPVAIWIENDEWNCVIGTVGEQRHYTDRAYIDEEIFSRCCRAAITYEEYERACGYVDK